MKKKITICSVLVIITLVLWYCNGNIFCKKLIYHINQLLLSSKYINNYNEYLKQSTEKIIVGDIDTIDTYTISLINKIYTNDNDSFNACASNMVLGVICYQNSDIDSALVYLLNAERFSDSRPELKPHIYYYLASAFVDYDPILAHDIIHSHPKERINKYDYSKFNDINVSQQEMDLHIINSIYYSRLIQQSLDAQASQHHKEIRLYRYIIVSVAIFLVLSILFYFIIKRYRHKNAMLTNSVANHKTNFDALLKKYVELYRTKCDRNSVYDDANEMLSVLHNGYASLSKSDIAIIWLILLSFDIKEICSILNISNDYYYQRRTNIRKALNFNSTRELNDGLKKFVPEYLSEYG